MTDSIVNVIKAIQDGEKAKVRFLISKLESVYLDCIFKESDAPSFFLVFQPNTIPENLETQKNCSISITKLGEPIIISAKILSRKGERTLELNAIEIIDPVSLREYFRVFYQTSITAVHHQSRNGSGSSSWKLEGTTVDLSASGVLAIFPQEFEHKDYIFLEFSLKGNSRRIQCLAHVVRVHHIRKSRCQIALRFDQISAEDQDEIVSECMREQRRQLRERMQEE